MCSTYKKIQFVIEQEIGTGSLDSGSSISLISFDTSSGLESRKVWNESLKAFNKKVLAAKNSELKTVGSVDIKFKKKTKIRRVYTRVFNNGG